MSSQSGEEVKNSGVNYEGIVRKLTETLHCDTSYVAQQVEQLIRQRDDAAQFISRASVAAVEGDAPLNTEPVPTTGLNIEAKSEIQRLMREKNWSRSDLARALEVSRVTITQMLDPARNLTLNTLEKVVRKMGYTVHLACQPQFENRYREDDDAAASPSLPAEPSQPLCAVHRRLEADGSLECEIGNDCVACSLNERRELLQLIAPFAATGNTEDSVTVMRRVAEFYATHAGDGRVIVSYPATAAEPEGEQENSK